MQDLMTIDEAAEHHKCSSATIKLAINQGKIIGRQTCKGGRWWLLGSSVREWSPDRNRQLGTLRSLAASRAERDPSPAHPAVMAGELMRRLIERIGEYETSTAARLDALTAQVADLRADLRPVLDALT